MVTSLGAEMVISGNTCRLTVKLWVWGDEYWPLAIGAAPGPLPKYRMVIARTAKTKMFTVFLRIAFAKIFLSIAKNYLKLFKIIIYNNKLLLKLFFWRVFDRTFW
jgi:hypothetical protein